MSGIMLFLVVFLVLALLILGMSAGVLAGRAPIAGSCGGIANLGIEKECSICGGVREKCDEVNAQEEALAKNAMQAYDATKR